MRDQPHARVRHQDLADLHRVAKDKVQRAVEHAGVDEGLHQLHGAGRRGLGGLQDDRTTGGVAMSSMRSRSSAAARSRISLRRVGATRRHTCRPASAAATASCRAA